MSEVRSAAVWERGGMMPSPLTVTLQEVEVQNKRLVMALVCQGEGQGERPQLAAGYLCESMVGWFYNELLSYCSKKTECAVSELEQMMRRQWERVQAEWQEYAKKQGMESAVKICGLLCFDSSYVAWGNLPVYVLNRRFNKPRKKMVFRPGQDITFSAGEIAGFLSFFLANEGMSRGIRDEELLESLYTEKKVEEARLQKRLGELGKAAAERTDKMSVGAVIVEVEP